MESSFFEYRDEAGADSDLEAEIIDNSCDESSSLIKKKNHTVFVAETDESLVTDDESDSVQNKPQEISKSVITRSVVNNHVVSSSDDDSSRRGSIRRQSQLSNKLVLSSSEDDTSRRGSIRRQSESSNKQVLSSSDNDASSRNSIRRQSESSHELVVSSSEDELGSPEIVPKRRPPIRRSIASNDSIIGRKTKKRMMLLDSDTENSIIIEHDKHKKLLCMKDTPLKTDSGVRNGNDSDCNDEDGSDIEDEADSDGKDGDVTKYTDDEDDISNKNEITKNGDDKPANIDESAVYETDDGGSDDDNDDDGDDHMVMSRATRMSIMGVIPKDNESDDSDFIESDDSHRKSGDSGGSLSGLPDVGLAPKPEESPVEDLDSTRMTCSPFSSPLRDITNKSIKNAPSSFDNKDECIIIDEPNGNKSSAVKNKWQSKENFIKYDDDDDVTIIDTKPEIIALSSDDEDEVKPEKSPKVKKSLKPKHEETDIKPASESIKQYLVPPSYPNQVVYVKKHVRENELTKLEALKEDLRNIRYLLEEMDVDTLPDGGGKLIERLTKLEEDVRRQGDKVANMIVEPDNPTARDIAKDGFGSEDKKGLSWDDIQKASNAVQPRMFGKQAMATHMAERNMIMDRLRDLYESLASRPADSELAAPPAGVSSQLMPHQLHALAWLQWRETQRPRAGILADDMGLGKTITMIALMVSDKEKRIDDDEDDDDDDRPAKGRLTSGGTLVVCPASLIQQWGGEVGKHCAAHALSVCLHHGPARAQQPHRLAAHDLVVTTYNILQRDNEKNGVLMRVRWRRAILDEAHIVRNHKAATSVAVSALRAVRRWCLTGTPVQNKDLDLFALLKFLRCSPFDDLTMWKKWIDNKSLGGQERLSTIMRSILLRRTKVQLQQRGQLDCLPDRTAHETKVTLTKAEMNVYQKVLVFSKTLFAQFLHQRAEKNSDGGFTAPGKDSEYAKMHKKMIALQGAKPVKSHEILVLLLRLRQVCCHCGLIAAMLDEEGAGEVADDAAGQDLLAELTKLSLEDSRDRTKNNNPDEGQDEGPEPEGTTAAEAIRSVLSPNNPVFDLATQSSKIQAVMDCLEENVFKNKGDKAVVVSQWTSVLRLVEAGLRRRRVRSVTLSGAVPVPARPPLINALNDPNNDVKVMLLSLCAGGVGLNLCGANHLLLLDPHWNPQLEEQAQDRIYRVGQKKAVNIYRFMCVDTVEQTIRKLQEAKLELAENVLTGARNTNASKLTIEDLKMLFNMGPTPPVN